MSGRREKTADGGRNLKVVRGGGVSSCHCSQGRRLEADGPQINEPADAVSRQGIKVAVQGVATFKIGADDESSAMPPNASSRSARLGIDSIVKNVLEGSLRSIVGTLTIEGNLDRQKFQQAVQDAAKGDLATSDSRSTRSRSRRSATSPATWT